MLHYAAFHLGLHCKGTPLGVSHIQRVKMDFRLLKDNVKIACGTDFYAVM